MNQTGNPDLYNWFKAVDQDCSGKITADELRQALVNGKWSNFSLEACQVLISMFDRDNSKTIDYVEFQQLFDFINQWRSAFQMYDKDHSQAIDKLEFGQALSQMGYHLSDPATLDSIFKRFDYSKKGQITLDSFIIACVQLHKLTNAFRSHDKQGTAHATFAFEEFMQTILQ